ncbi:uncharacterized protein LOC135825590 [Sycon ciliatum]|uniref:uncharacterized protein LOC135825590 n=1 Tax=Sycon ciliatum TaxID=27933 RepID=UPI0031F6918C
MRAMQDSDRFFSLLGLNVADVCFLGDIDFDMSTCDLIASGMHAWVYRTWHPDLGLHVAIKLPNPVRVHADHPEHKANMLKFGAEFKRMSMLQHPNIGQVIGLARSKGNIPLIVMELLASNLHDAIGPPSQVSGIRGGDSRMHGYLRDVAAGLHYLHMRHFIHRDLTLANVLLTQAGDSVKITDVGISLLYHDNGSGTGGKLTSTPGNCIYMAPETFPWSAAEGQCVDYDSSIDIFAFGVLATAVLTGRLPDPQIRLAPYFRENADGKKVPIPEVERRKAELDRLDDCHVLKPIILRCLSNDPTQRPSAFELHEHILRWLGEAEDKPEQDTIEKTVADASATSQPRRRQQNTPPRQQQQERPLAPNTTLLEQTLDWVSVSKQEMMTAIVIVILALLLWLFWNWAGPQMFIAQDTVASAVSPFAPQWKEIAAPWETSLFNILYAVVFRGALFCFFTPDSDELRISYTGDVEAALGVAWHAVEVPKHLELCQAVYASTQHIYMYAGKSDSIDNSVYIVAREGVRVVSTVSPFSQPHPAMYVSDTIVLLCGGIHDNKRISYCSRVTINSSSSSTLSSDWENSDSRGGSLLPVLPQATSHANIFPYNGDVYLAGGFNETAKDFPVYSLHTDSSTLAMHWVRSSIYPPIRKELHGATVTAYNGKLFIANRDHDPRKTHRECYSIDLASSVVKQLPPLPSLAIGPYLSAFDGHLIAFGNLAPERDDPPRVYKLKLL